MATDLRERMKAKFQEQVTFLQASGNAFDNGNESEAVRMATQLRIFFHDSRGNPKNPSKSLISHMGLRNRKILSSSRGHRNQMDYLSYALDVSGQRPARMVPILGDKFHGISIPDWWRGERVLEHNGKSVSRSKLILDAANKDGGAHVDEQLPAYYESLQEGDESIGIGISGLKFNGKPPFPEGVIQFARNSHLSLIRQFVHEFLASVSFYDYLNEKLR